jgi:hypothetical protein
MSMKDDALELAGKTISQLREEIRQNDEFINSCCELIPPSYDGDESQESIILKYLTDVYQLGNIIARLTSDYRR